MEGLEVLLERGGRTVEMCCDKVYCAIFTLREEGGEPVRALGGTRYYKRLEIFEGESGGSCSCRGTELIA